MTVLEASPPVDSGQDLFSSALLIQPAAFLLLLCFALDALGCDASVSQSRDLFPGKETYFLNEEVKLTIQLDDLVLHLLRDSDMIVPSSPLQSSLVLRLDLLE